MCKNLSESKIGLLQALGAAVYCFLIANVFKLMENVMSKSPDLIGVSFILFLLVFSVAVVGSLIFGYAIYLLFQKETKNALNVLGYTLLYGLAIIIIVLFFVTLL